MGRPPPYIRAMPERKRFFLIDVFPNAHIKSKLAILEKHWKQFAAFGMAEVSAQSVG